MAGAKTAKRPLATGSRATKERRRYAHVMKPEYLAEIERMRLMVAAFLSCAAAYALEVSSDEAREAVAGWAPLWLECRYLQHIYGVYLPIAVVLVVVERGAKRFQMLHEKFVCDSRSVISDFVHNNPIDCEALCHNCGAASMRNVVNSDFPLQYILAFHCGKFWRANASNSQGSNYREVA